MEAAEAVVVAVVAKVAVAETVAKAVVAVDATVKEKATAIAANKHVETHGRACNYQIV